MNRRMVAFVTGRILIITAILMLPSMLVAVLYGEGWTGLWPFLVAQLLALATGLPLGWRKPELTRIYVREGFVVVALSWIALSLFGALPFLLSGAIPDPIDAFFETASGFTTTGASILHDVEALPHSLLFWRSFTHLVGGMGVLVFALAVLPSIDSDDVNIMRAEVPGPSFGKVRARIRHSARLLYAIYLSMTLLLVLLLWLGRMPLFDSFVHAFGAAGTGGFGIRNSSVAYYNSAYIDYVLAIAMLLFGVNFNLYSLFVLYRHRAKEALNNEELRWYGAIVLAGIALILFDVLPLYDTVGDALRVVVFTVSSIITTTGYTIADFSLWPLFSRVLLLLMMFIGGMAGSTAGGLKISRIVIYLKTVIQEWRRAVSSNRRLPVLLEGKALSDVSLLRTYRYLMIYVGLFIVQLVLLSLAAPNFLTAFSAVAATFNNIGPGLDVVGPAGNYAVLGRMPRLLLSVGMIMGRLEIIPILVLFSPRTWRRG